MILPSRGGEFDVGLLGEFVEAGQPRRPCRRGSRWWRCYSLAFLAALVPDGDLVDLEILDGLDLLGDEFGELFDEEEGGAGRRGSEPQASMSLR